MPARPVGDAEDPTRPVFGAAPAWIALSEHNSSCQSAKATIGILAEKERPEGRSAVARVSGVTIAACTVIVA